MIELGGRLPETENNRTYRTSDLKTGHGCLRNLSSGGLQETSWNSTVFDWETKRLFSKWSFAGDGP